MRMWKEGQRRRSPRISALDGRKVQQPRNGRRHSVSQITAATSTDNANPPRPMGANVRGRGPAAAASTTSPRKKRRLRPVLDVSASTVSPTARQHQQGGKQLSFEDYLTNTDQPVCQDGDGPEHDKPTTRPDQQSNVPAEPRMPEKRVLELILDTLQRRDTHEIFAEPVDPDEVEDYYEIIKEPMDFGTMRAKLHEGIYNSLEQFEHDVFLIFRNAMHFNSSATIYFRQARAIDELAKKVFHVLKTDPENFENEFSDTRRRSGRRVQGEARGSIYSSCPKLATNLKSSSMVTDVSSKVTPRSISCSANLKRSVRVNPDCSSTATRLNIRDHEVLFGTRDGRRSSTFEADRRCTYRPWTSFLREDDSTVSAIYSNPKPLYRVNQQDIGYTESLMLFVKDLGPTAQMIARRKLNGWFQAPEPQNPMASTTAPCRSGTLNTTINVSDGMDMHDAGKEEEAYAGDKMGTCDFPIELTANNGEKIISGAFGRKAHSSNRKNILGISGNGKVRENESTGTQLQYSIADARDLKFSVVGLKNRINKSKNSALEDSQSDVLDCRLINRNGFSSSSSKCLGGNDQTPALKDPTHVAGGSCKIDETPKLSQQQSPPVSQFIFDLPYLKTRLDQINSLGQDRLLQQGLDTKRIFLDKTSYSYKDNHQCSSLDSQHTDLALQL